jgi:hypothetical protein
VKVKNVNVDSRCHQQVTKLPLMKGEGLKDLGHGGSKTASGYGGGVFGCIMRGYN